MIHCFPGEQRPPFLKFTFILLFVCLGWTANAQTIDCSVSSNCGDPYCQFAADVEKGCNCFDGLDNDGDAKVDKADSNCATYYGLSFVGEDADCSIIPPGANTPFDLVDAPVTSAQNTADTQSKVSVGDVDSDGIPDAVITSKWNSEFRVVATADGQADGTAAGSVKSSFNLTSNAGKAMFNTVASGDISKLKFEHENLIADIDGDGIAELYGVASLRGSGPTSPPTQFFLVGFEYAEDELVPLFNAVDLGTDRPGTFGIADMDGDGKAEIYMRDRIYAAETGALLATGNGNWDLDVTSGPVAIDIMGDEKMELVSGTKIYSIPSFADRNPATPANLTLAADMNTLTANKAYVKLSTDLVEYGVDTHSMCSVADIDKDGNMDVVISGALNSNTGPTAVFYWNVAKGTVSHYVVTDPGYVNGWPWGTGRVNLGDANGDGNLDLSFIAGSYLHTLTTDASGNLVPLWAAPRQINDTRSGVLTVSIYDFNNDGEPEMVYRDSQQLVVIDGATGTQVLWSAACQSHTYTEGPVIADVNGDGATDICVACNTSNSFNINAGIAQQALGQFRLYYSSGNEWLPTRKVWNQPGYFVTNINDDLTLPFPQLDQNTVFGEGDCLNGLPGPQMPLNVFMNQVPHLAANGCPVYPAPDLAFDGDNPDNPGVDENGDGVYTPAVEVTPPICGDLATSVRFNIINSGDLPITADIPVSFFVGDPTDPGITSDSLLHSTTLPISNLAVDSTYTSDLITFNATGAAFRLYIVLNNDGSILPIDPSGSVTNECRIDNNIYSVFIEPDPFETKIEKIKDNFKCEDSAPNSGELRVRIFKAGVEVTDYSEYGFQWYTGTTASYTPISGATNYNILGLAEGDYTAIVTNTAKGCTGIPVDTVVLRQGNDPEVVINVTSHQTVCAPPNGELQAVITGGNTGFTFEWFDIALNPLGISGPTANNLVAGNYLVRVSKDGCSKNSLPQTVDGPVVPDATAETLQNIVDCLNPSTGSITATALFNGVEQDPANYSFEWYFYDNATATRGSTLPAAHGTGETRTGLPVGHYQVVVTDLATQCASIQFPVTEITSQTLIPTAIITELAPQTSCDPATPNGRMSAAVELEGVMQDPANFTFEWFKGDNTLAANAHNTVSGTNGSIAESVSGGGVFYTVRVTTGNNCTDTEKLIITEDLNVPLVTLTPTDNGICDPALAASNYNGTVTADITFDGVAVTDLTNYTITWHQGSLDTDPVIPETDTLLDERNGGFYTAVVERTDLSCVSAPVTAEVLNATVLPTIETDSIPSTNCVGGAPNGGVTVTSIVPADTYSYRWFDPSSTLIAGETANAISGYQGGAGQNYTVEVTLASTGCRNTIATGIPDVKVNPLVSLDPNPNTICNPALTNPFAQYNGSVLSTITNQSSFPISDYEFTWTDEETGAEVLQAVGAAGKDLLNRDSSSYTLIVRHVSTECVSNPITAQVLSTSVLPVITAEANASTNCVPALADGQAVVTDVDGAGTVAPYVFQWHDGNDISTPLSGETNPLLDNRQGGVGEFYTVLVTNQNDGCQSTRTIEIPDARVLPLVTLTATPNSICDALLAEPDAAYNGSVAATISNIGAFPITDYHFTWTDEEDGATVLDADGGAAIPGENLLNRDTSQYTVIARQISTGCESSPASAEVTSNFTFPDITANANASTNCVPALADGQAVVTDVDGAGTVAPYVFQWHDGNDTSNPLAGETNPLLDNRQGGVGEFYTVLVTNQNDGCQSTQTLEIPDARVLPLVTLLATPNSICDSLLAEPDAAYNGSVAATISNIGAFPITDYHFVWTDEEDGSKAFEADGGAAIPGENLLNRDTSQYTVIARQISTGCESNPATAEVTSNFTFPDITANANASTNCVPALADGQAVVTDVDGAGTVAPYVFQWHDGNDTSNPLAGETNPLLDNRQGGVGEFYTVLVTNQNDGCQSTQTLEIPDARVLPLVTLLATPNSICDSLLAEPDAAYNGSVAATISNIGAFPITDYHFTWTDEEDGATVLDADGGAAIPGENLLNRDTSQYTVIARQISTGCESNPATAEVTSNFTFPDITANANASTNCVPALADGQAVVTDVDGAGTVAPYVFQWHDGNDTSTPLAGETNPLLDNRQGGVGEFYTVLVTNQNDGCQSTQTLEIPDARVLPLVTLLATPNSICDSLLAEPDAVYNGSVAATISNIGAFPITDYHFIWTDEEDGSKAFEADGGGPSFGETLANRDTSSYTLVATQTSTGCVSSPVTAEITPDFDLPVIAADANASTNCEPTLANGGVQVLDVDGAGTPATYQYDWFSGNTVGGAVIADVAVSPDTLQGGAGNFFTALVTNLNSGCQNTKTVEVPDERILPLVSLLATPSTVCDSLLAEPDVAYTGSVAATISNQLGSITDYHFIWTDEEDGSKVFEADGGGVNLGETLANRDTSSYTLVATQTSTGCVSSPVTAEITPDFDLPVIAADANASTNCEPTLANGGVQVLDVDGAGTPATYQYDWFSGNTVGGAVIADAAVSPDTLQGGGGNFFTALVTNLSSGCQNTKTVEVPDERILPLLSLLATPNTVCDSLLAEPDVAYTGSVAATINNQLGSITDYHFIWTDEEDGSKVFEADGGGVNFGETLANRDTSSYTLVAEQMSTGCVSSPVTAEITPDFDLPVITADANASTNCEPTLANGGVQVLDVDGVGTPATYQYDWFSGNTVLGAVIADAAVSPDTLQGGAGNFFTTLVTNLNSGCQNTKTVEVPDERVLPLVSLLATPNTVCDSVLAEPDAVYTGNVAATISNMGLSPITDYHFIWTDEEDGSKVFEADGGGVNFGQTLANRDTSFYTLVAEQISTGCVSSPVTAEVKPDFFIPVIDIASTPQTSCDPANPNGILMATIDETSEAGNPAETAGYDFVWQDGAGVAVGTTGAGPWEIISLAGDASYGVEVTRLTTGCRNTSSAYLPENIVIPTATLAATPQTYCNPADGAITATVNPAPSDTYTFYWMKEEPYTTTTDTATVISTVKGSPASPNRRATGAIGANTDTHSGLYYADYTLVVVDNYTSCISTTYTATVLDERNADVDFTVSNTPSSCQFADGQLDLIAVRADGVATTFNFDVYMGGPTNPVTPIHFDSNPPVFDMTINDGATARPVETFPQNYGGIPSGATVTVDNLQSELYSVVVEDGFGCKNLETFFLPFVDAHEVDFTYTDSQICPYTIGDGAISVRAIPPPTNPEANQSKFTFRFYEGTSANPATSIVMPPAAGDPSILSGSGEELCGNGIDDDGNGLIDDLCGIEICGNGIDDDFDGAIDEDCVGADPYYWPVATEDCTNGPDDDGDGFADAADSDCSGRLSAQSLAPGFYTVEIQENISGSFCKVYQVIEIGRDALPPIIDLTNIEPNTACDLAGADGQFTLNIDQPAADSVAAVTYDFNVAAAAIGYNNPYASVPAPANTTITALQPATYTINVTASTGCTATKDFTIQDAPMVAEIAENTVVDAEFCDPALETSARVEITRLSILGTTEIANGADDDGDGLVDAADPDYNDNLSDYTFEWYTDAAMTNVTLNATAGDATGVDGGEVLSNVGSPAPAPPVTIGSYYVVATKVIAGATGGFGCSSAPAKVDIGDKTVTPTVTLHPFGDTSCDGNFEGRIEMEGSTANLAYPAPYSNPGSASTFTYEWDATNPIVLGTTLGNNGNRSNSEPDRDVEANLEPGTYVVTVINEATGCRVNATSTIQKISPPVFTLDLVSLPQDICDPSGSIEVNDAFVNGVSDGTVNFDYQYFAGDPNTAALAVPNTTLINAANYATIKAGTFYVVATRKANTDPGSGCSSAPHRIDIMDTSEDPTVVLTPFANTSCDLVGNFEGSITLEVTDPGSAPSATYTYDWDAANPFDIEGGAGPIAGNDGDADGTDGDGDNPLDIKDGTYNVTITNDASGCFVNAQTTVLKTEIPVIIAQATPLPQVICNPDGSITVNSISVGGAVEPQHTDFDFTWYRNDLGNQIVAATNNLDVLNTASYPTIGAGTYFVKVKRVANEPGFACESAPVRVDIKDNTEDPTVVLTPFANTSCDLVGNFEGSITLEVTDPGSAPSATYTYDWDAANPFDIEGGAGPIAGNDGDADGTDGDGDNPIDIKDGTYNVTVTNDASGCFVNAQTTVLKTEIPVIIAQATALPQVICNPDGSITVNNITVGGAVEPQHTDFDFTWYRNDLGNQIVAATNNLDVLNTASYPTIGAGTYFVKVKRVANEPGFACESAPVRVDIKDNTEDPTVVLTPFANTSCDLVGNFEGSITLEVTDPGSAPSATYTYDWDAANPFDIEGGLGPIAGNDGDADGTDGDGDNPIDIKDGTYNVTVTNDASGCFVNAQTTVLKTEIPVIIAQATALPQVICNPDGSITVNNITVGGAVEPQHTDFDFTWYRNDLGNQIVAATNNLDILNTASYPTIGAGTYFVKVKRVANEPGFACESAPVRVDIKDNTEDPTVVLTPFANTSCDLVGNFEGSITLEVTDPGSAPSATYTYDWDAANPFDIEGGAGPIAGNDGDADGTDGDGDNPIDIKDGTYNVTVTNDASGCFVNAQTTVLKTEIPVIIAQATALPQVICNPDGSITVNNITVGGAVEPQHTDFDFTWYRNDLGNQIVAATNNLDVLNTASYPTIGAGTYFVKVKRVANEPGFACESAPVRVDIKDNTEDPTVVLTPFANTSCDLVGNFEGSITLEVTDPGSAPSATYTYDWDAANPFDIEGGLGPIAGNDGDADGTDGDGDNPIDIKDGTYNVTVTNDASGCFVNAQTTVLKTEIPVIIAQATALPQVICNPDGSITVNNITVGGAVEPQHTDFDFTWYRNDLGNQIIAATNNLDALNTASYPTIGAGTYFVKVKRIANEPGFACESAPVRVDIEDNTEDPTVVLTPFANTSCDLVGNFEGSITLEVTDPGSAPSATYTYDWDNGNPSIIEVGGVPVAGNNGNADGTDGDGDNPLDLKDGTYRVTITNDASGCFVNTQTTILKTKVPIIIPQATATPQFLCNPDGSITVNTVSVGGVNEPDHNAFDFTWYKNNVTSAAIVGPSTGEDVLDISNYATIGAGTYFVKARRISGAPGFACESIPVRIDIKDSRVNPTVSFLATSNTACDGNFDAQLTVNAFVESGPGMGGNYNMTFTPPAGSAIAPLVNGPSPYSTTAADIVGHGTYIVRVENTATECFVNAGITIVHNPQPVEILQVSKQDQMICFPDGSITVSAVSPAVVPDYSFNWFRSNTATPALDDGTSTIIAPTLDNTNYPAMGADTYFVVGQKLTALGSGCLTPPFRVNIEDRHVDPTLALTFTPNSSCNPANPNGQLIATASERDESVDNYAFEWTLNSADLQAPTTQLDGAATSQLDNAFEGQYAVVVTNNVTGCDFSSGLAVKLDQSVSLPNIITVDTFDPLDCLGSGSAEVTAISVGGRTPIEPPNIAANFQFEWYLEEFPANRLSETAPLLDSINAGRYFVRVQDLMTDCKSSPTEVVVLADEIVYPVVTIDQTALQVRCTTTNGTAELIARGDGNTDANPAYQFSWFDNLETSGSPFSSTSTISNMLHGEYSVLVTNDSTGCSASRIYVIRDDSDRYMPQLSINTEARTNCLVPDGALMVREVGYDPNSGYPYPSLDYKTERYPGAGADVTQAGTEMNYVTGFNRNWLDRGLEMGAYTVKITDNNTGCWVTGVDVIADERTNPVVTIVEDNPLINCDPARPNGQLSATADGGLVGGYQFNWFGDAITGGMTTDNNKLIGIGMGDYTVHVTNDITNCFAEATASISDGRLLPPSPTAVLIRDRTRCDYPDGVVAANVDGVTLNYSFDWYDGETVDGSPDFIGDRYEGRDIGIYSVTAMDETTGCISLPDSVSVKDLRLIPEVVIHTTASYCEELPGQIGGTGTAEIELIPANVLTDQVEWTLQPDMATIGIGSYLTDILPGLYQAHVVTSSGCEAVGLGEVPVEIFSYNLVSSNGDNKNDNFRIDCITMFPNNHVKIFNRAGVLVYEASGYDNIDVVFRGIGEKGVYTIGNELPVGTYFYIIDKGNGSKPKTGFLELVK